MRVTQADILLVRHPETEANVDGRLIGRGDTPLTAEGERQLERLPGLIAAFEPEEVWASPLHRALLPARLAAEMAACPLVVDERLIELDFGDAEGLTFAEIALRGIRFDYRNSRNPVAPNGESRCDIEERSAAVVSALAERGGRFAVVTHGGVFRASMVTLLGLASEDIWAFHIKNSQLAHVRVVDGHGMLEEYVQG